MQTETKTLTLEGQTTCLLYSLPEVDSTNLFLQERLQRGEATLAAAYSGKQTAGRGRLGRTWNSPEGGLYLSFLSPVGAAKPLDFGMAACLVLLEELATSVPRVSIKWPNDLVVSDLKDPSQERKIGGFLSSFVPSPESEGHVVVGVGINMNAVISLSPEERGGALEPVSVRELTGEEVNLAAFVEAVAPRVFSSFRSLQENPRVAHDELLQRWRARSSTPGREVKITRTNGDQLLGKAVGIGDEFQLLLEVSPGQVLKLQEGDCQHLRF